MKRSLREKQWIAIAVLIAGFLIMFLSGENIPALMAGIAVALAAAGLDIAWRRCPACGKHLGRAAGDYCPWCGKKIDWNARKP